jgi:type IV secretion system protein VirD4
MNNRIRVEGDFAFPSTQGSSAADFTAAIVFSALVAALMSWGLTAWFASRLAYRSALGSPWFHYATVPIYPPWSWVTWRANIAAHYPSSYLVTQTEKAPAMLAIAAALGGVLIFTKRYRRRTNRAGELHGSAHKARPGEVDRTGLVALKTTRARFVRWLQAEPVRYGVILASWVDPRARVIRLLRDISTRHVMVVAPPRSGKGVGIVIPTLLTCRDSCVVNDPKGELYRDTAGRRLALGQRVFLFAPAAEVGRSAKWNPLRTVRLGTDHEVSDAQRVATIMLSETKSEASDGNIWTLAARAPLSACILHVLYRARARRQGTASLAHVLREFTSIVSSYDEVLTGWSSYPHDPDFECGWALADGSPSRTHPFVAATALAQIGLDEKVRSSVKFTLDAALSLYEDVRLQQNLDGDDFYLEDLVYGPTPVTVYVQYPMADVQRLGPVLRLFYELLMLRSTEDIDKLEERNTTVLGLLLQRLGLRRLGRAAFRASGFERLARWRDGGDGTSFRGMEPSAPTPPAGRRRKLLMMLDEFPNLGRMRSIEAALPVCPGFGIRVVIVIQGWEQLRSVYGKDETITPVMHTRVAYAPNTYDTAKVLSEMCGRTTALQTTRRGTFLSKLADQENQQLVGRALYTPDELLRLPGPRMDDAGERILAPGKVLVFAAGAPVIEALQLLFWEQPSMLAWAKLPPPVAHSDTAVRRRVKMPAPLAAVPQVAAVVAPTVLDHATPSQASQTAAASDTDAAAAPSTPAPTPVPAPTPLAGTSSPSEAGFSAEVMELMASARPEPSTSSNELRVHEDEDEDW